MNEFSDGPEDNLCVCDQCGEPSYIGKPGDGCTKCNVGTVWLAIGNPPTIDQDFLKRAVVSVSAKNIPADNPTSAFGVWFQGMRDGPGSGTFSREVFEQCWTAAQIYQMEMVLHLHDVIASNNKCNDYMQAAMLAAEKERDELRAALLPFAAAAMRPGKFTDPMTDRPLPDEAILGLGVKLTAWKRAIELTGAQ